MSMTIEQLKAENQHLWDENQHLQRENQRIRVRLKDETDEDNLLEEHRQMIIMLMQVVDAMKITQRLFDLPDGHLLMSKCREIERWLDAHQAI
jgi:regulator of replication initiation timing